MSDDIEEAKRVSFSIIDSRRGTPEEPSEYILVPFNDPGSHMAYLVIYIYIYIIQCPPLILAPLINMSKGGCENKSALFILLIFPSKNLQNSNLSLK